MFHTSYVLCVMVRDLTIIPDAWDELPVAARAELVVR